MNCHGDEESLFACHHLGLGEHKCDKGERAGVKCHKEGMSVSFFCDHFVPRANFALHFSMLSLLV